MRTLVFTMFCALLVAQSAVAANWNQKSISALGIGGRIKEKANASLEDYRASYIQYYDGDKNQFAHQTVKSEGVPRPIPKLLETDKFVTTQLNKTGLLSYLLFSDGKLVIDEISPENRLGDLIKPDETVFNSQSVGKSVVSYLLGHAICQGYISSLDSKLDDWPMVANTLYSNQPIVELINMTAGDGAYFKDSNVIIGGVNSNLNLAPVSSWINGLRGTTPSKGRFGDGFNYNGFLPNMINNYIAFKTGDEYVAFLQSVFVKHVKIESDVFFIKQYAPLEQGPLRSTFFASRYDYLRLAITMLEDWKTDSCIGKYLKELKNRRETGLPGSRTWLNEGTYKNYDYGGYFYMDVRGTGDNVFGMGGYGGQSIFMNFDTGTLVVAHAVHQDYDIERLIFDPVRTP
jgi:CubicO group peptidase (beta-lactamase class C family)